MTAGMAGRVAPPMRKRRHPGLSEPKTKEEWRAYVLAGAPSRPATLTREQYEQLGEDERTDYDRARQAVHGAGTIVKTPFLRELHEDMTLTAQINLGQSGGARRGHIIDGPATIGKSTILKTFGREWELDLRRDYPEEFDQPCRDYIPVVYLSMPAEATPKMVSTKIANYLGLPVRSRANVADITDSVLQTLDICGTEIVLIDDVHFLNCSDKAGKLANDHLKYLANYCAATFVYAGVDVTATGLFSEGSGTSSTQTSGRFALLNIEPFATDLLTASKTHAAGAETARAQALEWARIIRSMEDSWMLLDHEAGSLASKHWRYLLERTGGRISTLAILLRTASTKAVGAAVEAVTPELMDTIKDDWLATKDAAERAARAGKRAKAKATRTRTAQAS